MTTTPESPDAALEEWLETDGRSAPGSGAVRVSKTLLCGLLGIPRTAQYRKHKEPDTEMEERIKARLDYWHTMMPHLGSRKLVAKLREDDTAGARDAAEEGREYRPMGAGRKLVRRYMSEMGIVVVHPKPKLSSPAKHHKKYPYLLRDKSFIRFPNQVWAVDITYIKMSHGHMYLTAIIDWHSRCLLGWDLSDTLDAAPVCDAVKAAMDRHGVPAIINSDQGSQFTSDEYTALLREKRVRQSMDGKGRWVDNVVIERWFRSFKTEWLYVTEINTPRELRAGIAAYISDYNFERPHQSLGYKKPAEMYDEAFNQERLAA
jgi:putative transposase